MLFEKIKNDLAEAMKSRNEMRVSVMRLLLSEVKNFEIKNYPPDCNGKLTDEDILSVIKRMVKTHNESITMFEKGGRKDLVEKEKLELNILMSYLPKQISKDAVLEVVKRVVMNKEIDFGKAMKAVMAELKGKADGKMVSELVKKELEK